MLVVSAIFYCRFLADSIVEAEGKKMLITGSYYARQETEIVVLFFFFFSYSFFKNFYYQSFLTGLKHLKYERYL